MREAGKAGPCCVLQHRGEATTAYLLTFLFIAHFLPFILIKSLKLVRSGVNTTAGYSCVHIGGGTSNGSPAHHLSSSRAPFPIALSSETPWPGVQLSVAKRNFAFTVNIFAHLAEICSDHLCLIQPSTARDKGHWVGHLKTQGAPSCSSAHS